MTQENASVVITEAQRKETEAENFICALLTGSPFFKGGIEKAIGFIPVDTKAEDYYVFVSNSFEILLDFLFEEHSGDDNFKCELLELCIQLLEEFSSNPYASEVLQLITDEYANVAPEEETSMLQIEGVI